MGFDKIKYFIPVDWCIFSWHTRKRRPPLKDRSIIPLHARWFKQCHGERILLYVFGLFFSARPRRLSQLAVHCRAFAILYRVCLSIRRVVCLPIIRSTAPKKLNEPPPPPPPIHVLTLFSFVLVAPLSCATESRCQQYSCLGGSPPRILGLRGKVNTPVGHSYIGSACHLRLLMGGLTFPFDIVPECYPKTLAYQQRCCEW